MFSVSIRYRHGIHVHGSISLYYFMNVWCMTFIVLDFLPFYVIVSLMAGPYHCFIFFRAAAVSFGHFSILHSFSDVRSIIQPRPPQRQTSSIYVAASESIATHSHKRLNPFKTSAWCIDPWNTVKRSRPSIIMYPCEPNQSSQTRTETKALACAHNSSQRPLSLYRAVLKACFVQQSRL